MCLRAWCVCGCESVAAPQSLLHTQLHAYMHMHRTCIVCSSNMSLSSSSTAARASHERTSCPARTQLDATAHLPLLCEVSSLTKDMLLAHHLRIPNLRYSRWLLGWGFRIFGFWARCSDTSRNLGITSGESLRQRCGESEVMRTNAAHGPARHGGLAVRSPDCPCMLSQGGDDAQEPGVGLSAGP